MASWMEVPGGAPEPAQLLHREGWGLPQGLRSALSTPDQPAQTLAHVWQRLPRMAPSHWPFPSGWRTWGPTRSDPVVSCGHPELPTIHPSALWSPFPAWMVAVNRQTHTATLAEGPPGAEPFEPLVLTEEADLTT